VKAKHRVEKKCRLSLRESSVLAYFRGAKGDFKNPHDANRRELYQVLQFCCDTYRLVSEYSGARKGQLSVVAAFGSLGNGMMRQRTLAVCVPSLFLLLSKNVAA